MEAKIVVPRSAADKSKAFNVSYQHMESISGNLSSKNYNRSRNWAWPVQSWNQNRIKAKDSKRWKWSDQSKSKPHGSGAQVLAEVFWNSHSFLLVSFEINNLLGACFEKLANALAEQSPGKFYQKRLYNNAPVPSSQIREFFKEF